MCSYKLLHHAFKWSKKVELFSPDDPDLRIRWIYFVEVILFTRYSLLVIFYSLLVIFYSLLVIFYSLLVTRYFLLVTRYLLLVTRYFLLVTRYFLLVTRYFLLVTSYFLLVTRYSLFFTRYGKESCVLINYVLIEKRVEKTGTRWMFIFHCILSLVGQLSRCRVHWFMSTIITNTIHKRL